MRRILSIAVFLIFLVSCSKSNDTRIIRDLTNISLNEVKEYATNNKLKLEIKEEYNLDFLKDRVINQSIKEKSIIHDNDLLTITISLGPIPISVYEQNNVNELGNIPIMMYHSIVNKMNADTPYTGGNVDRFGYNRTQEAFKNDLEMYYQNNYRMIRLIDYMNGNIAVDMGKSPIVLTFDDGNKDNMNILGIDKNGELIIDPNSAVGILEAFKIKYPDFGVTATFFLNSNLFDQTEYNDKILQWLINHNYDVGNHTKNHADFTGIDAAMTQEEIAYMYNLFDSIIPNKDIHVIALPYGLPNKKSHPNFPYILNGSSNGYNYQTEGTLQVGWDAEYSPFRKDFDKTFMKRVRAWDNNGEEFDIQMVFANLKEKRYISDGNPNTIVIRDDKNLNINIKNKKIIKY